MGAESRADVLCLPHNHNPLSFSYWYSHFPLWRFRQHPLLTFTASLAAMTKFWPRRPEETSGKILSPDENRHYKSRKWFPQQWAPYLCSPQLHSKAASVCGYGGGVGHRKGSDKSVLLSPQVTAQPPPSTPTPNFTPSRLWGWEACDVLDSGAANLEEGWIEKKTEARLKLVHFHTCWSIVKYLNLEGKSSVSTRISSMYHP